MNTQLEKLFDRYELDAKDRYEFLQIYNLLSPQKRSRVIENFQDIMESISSLKQELAVEQEILLGNTLESIEKQLRARKILSVSKNTKEELSFFKSIL